MTTSVVITDFCVGDEIELDHLITGLPDVLATAQLGIIARSGPLVFDITPSAAPQGVILNPGVQQPDQTYTAEVIFRLTGGPAGDTFAAFQPGVTTHAYVNGVCGDTSGPFTAELIEFTPKVGGQYG